MVDNVNHSLFAEWRIHVLSNNAIEYYFLWPKRQLRTLLRRLFTVSLDSAFTFLRHSLDNLFVRARKPHF